MEILKKRKNICQTGKLLFMIALSIGYPLLFISYGLDFTDGPWNMRMANTPEDFLPYLLTAKISQAWTSIFGGSVISSRLLNYLFLQLTIGILFYTLYKKDNLAQYSQYMLISVILLVSTYSNNYGYGTTTTFWLAIIFICIFKYLTTRNLLYIGLCGIATFMAMLSRFPNVLLLPAITLLLFFFIFIRFHKTTYTLPVKLIFLIKLLSSYFAGFFIGVIFFSIIWGSPLKYIHETIATLSTYSQSDTYHSFHHLISGYLRDIRTVIKGILMMYILFAVYTYGVNSLKMHRWLSGLVILLINFYFIYISNTGNYNLGYSLNTTSFLVFLIFILIYLFFKNGNYVHLIIFLTIGILTVVPALGSNTGLLKSKTFVTLMVPFLFYSLFKIKKVSSEARRFFNIILISFLLFGVYNRISWFYGDTDEIAKLKYTIHHEKLGFIKTTLERKELVERIMVLTDNIGYDKNDLVFFGAAGQLFYYLFEGKSLSHQLFYLEPYDRKAIRDLEAMITKGFTPPVIVLFGSPNQKNWPQYLNEMGDKARPGFTKQTEELFRMLSGYEYSKAYSENAFIILTK